MEPAILGLVLDSSTIIEAERNHRTVEELLAGIQQRFGEIEITMSAVTVVELVHGIARAQKQEIRERRRAFIDERRSMYRCIRSAMPLPRLPEPSAANRPPKATRFRSTIY